MQNTPGVKIEIELKSDVTPQKIKDWVIWETARIKTAQSYPSLIYVTFLDFLLTNQVISEQEASRFKAVLGKVIARRRDDLGLNAAQLARAAKITPTQVAKLERGKASFSAYGGILLSLENYALMKGFADALQQMKALTSAPDFEARRVA